MNPTIEMLNSKRISRRHIQLAAAEIDRDGVPPRNDSRSFDVLVGSKQYPAKHLIRIAAKLASGTEPFQFHAHRAVTTLEELRYTVIDHKADAKTTIANDDDESAFPEGRERYRLHRDLERDPSISISAKRQRLETAGKLECDVCAFDFTDTYGELGDGFIEAHHTLPVSRLDGKTKTKVADLALVCSNCHRMLHRGRLLSVKELRKIVQARATN